MSFNPTETSQIIKRDGQKAITRVKKCWALLQDLLRYFEE
jgi:hypothetical protein